MALESVRTIDASGVDRVSGAIVLSVLDSWTWDGEKEHLLALQEKLNAYFDFVEAGEVRNLRSDAVDRSIVIDVVFRFPPPETGQRLLEEAKQVARDLGIELRSRVVPG